MRASQILRFVAIATITAAIVAAIPAAARAQTITACSANKSGSMYRVGTTGTPSDCTNANHKKETWNVQGPQGLPGVPGVSGYSVHSVTMGTTPAGSLSVIETCPYGKVVLAGGYSFSNSNEYRVNASQPYADPGSTTYDGWRVSAQNLSTTTPLSMTVWAICAKAAP